MNGILNIDKPAGWTSHDVVAWVRRVLRIKRVGHAGTLDPLATGVLLVCVGQATRVAEYLMASPKTYRAEAELGVITDTLDATGAVLETRPVPALTEADLHAALQLFVGDLLQTPPIYSAIKQDGVPLHRRARRGEIVQPEPRHVRIHAIRLLAWRPPRLTLAIDCDPGTYIRSLTHDLGQAVGCGAMLTALVRTRSGQFRVEEAVTPDALTAAITAGALARYLHPLQAALSALAAVPVNADEERLLRTGQPIPCPRPPAITAGYAITPGGEVMAIMGYDTGRAIWRPEKVFPASDV